MKKVVIGLVVVLSSTFAYNYLSNDIFGDKQEKSPADELTSTSSTEAEATKVRATEEVLLPIANPVDTESDAAKPTIPEAEQLPYEKNKEELTNPSRTAPAEPIRTYRARLRDKLE